MPQDSARALALTALASWRRSRRFADAIIQQLLGRSSLRPADRAFATELFYGVLRNLTLLDFWIALLRSGALDKGSRDLLRLGLYQLFSLRTPTHAAVFETVELSIPRQRPLINAVLRQAVRRLPELERAAEAESLATRYSHPEFLLQRWTSAYGPEAALLLCTWNNQPAPLYARINLLQTSFEEFLAHHPSARPLQEKKNFVQLKDIPSDALERGACYIQDPSTSVACELLDPQPGETVLDACAAPGGKCGLIAELMQNRGELITCDRDPARLQRLEQNLARLGATSARAVLQDWTTDELSSEFHPRIFDRILLDAPCTNTGVMRRRVDLRWRLRSEDIPRMQREQLAILRAVLLLLRPGGVLVYSTCSLEREENEGVVDAALATFSFLRLSEQRSVLPFRDQSDGAFAAKLKRVS